MYIPAGQFKGLIGFLTNFLWQDHLHRVTEFFSFADLPLPMHQWFKRKEMEPKQDSGGDDGIRTHDLCSAMFRLVGSFGRDSQF